MRFIYSIFLLTILINTGICGQELKNAGFEDWHFDDDKSKKILSGWLPDTYIGFDISEDSHEDNYAALIWMWYSYVPTRLFYGGFGGDAVEGRPKKLSGWYKYQIVPEGDSAYVHIYMKKWNDMLKRPDTIGAGRYGFIPSDEYSYFELDIEYEDISLEPDSMIISFDLSGNKTCLDFENWEENPVDLCKYLYLDGLKLENAVSGVEKRPGIIHVAYPNPVGSVLNLVLDSKPVHDAEIIIRDVMGRTVYTDNTGSHEGRNIQLDLSDLAAGIYSCSVISAGKVFYNVNILKE